MAFMGMVFVVVAFMVMVLVGMAFMVMVFMIIVVSVVPWFTHGAIKGRASRLGAALALPHNLLNLIVVLLADVLQLLLKLGLHHHQLFLGLLHNLQLVLYQLYSDSLQLRIPLSADLIQNPVMLLPAGLAMLIALISTVLAALTQHFKLNSLLCLDLSQPVSLLLLNGYHLIFMLDAHCFLLHLLLGKNTFQLCISLVSHIIQLPVVPLPASHLLIGGLLRTSGITLGIQPVNFSLPLHSGMVQSIFPLCLCDPLLLIPVKSGKDNLLLIFQVNSLQELFLSLSAHCAPVCTSNPPFITQ